MAFKYYVFIFTYATPECHEITPTRYARLALGSQRIGLSRLPGGEEIIKRAVAEVQAQRYELNKAAKEKQQYT